MKFGKLLKETTEGMPEMEDLFLRYKELKKHLKAMKKRQGETSAADAAHEETSLQEEASTSRNQDQSAEGRLSAEELAFVNTLNEDLQRFNRFFIDKEEDSVIKLQALSDRIKAATKPDELQSLKAELVDFHGEVVLLLHWSLLNYAAVVKILKKHDKRSGLLLRAPYLANVLQQPFYSTNVMSRLVKSAEEHINTLVIKQKAAGSPSTPSSIPQGAAAEQEAAAPAADPFSEAAKDCPAVGASSPAPAAAADDDAAISSSPASGDDFQRHQKLPVDTAVFARTRMALQTWDTLCSNASTPSTVLPAGSGELVRQLQVRERWARIVGVPHPAETAAAVNAVVDEGAIIPAAGAAGSRKQQHHEVEPNEAEENDRKKQRC